MTWFAMKAVWMTKNMTCVVVTALCNEPEAFASDLGDDQSRYLLGVTCSYIILHYHKVICWQIENSTYFRQSIVNHQFHCI